MKIIRNCNNPDCQKEYSAESKELNRGNGIYCSRSCSGIMASKNRPVVLESKIPNAECGYCHRPMHVKISRLKNSRTGLVFCNREHQILGIKDPSIDFSSGPVGKPVNRCNNCSKRLRNENDFCSKCNKEDKISRWLAGDISATWVSTSREPKDFVKKYLLETRGDKCEECGFDRKRPNGTSKIQMDHIDGDYTNNEITNLKLLCPNCHDDTETYGSKNKNGGRRYRLTKLANS